MTKLGYDTRARFKLVMGLLSTQVRSLRYLNVKMPIIIATQSLSSIQCCNYMDRFPKTTLKNPNPMLMDRSNLVPLLPNINLIRFKFSKKITNKKGEETDESDEEEEIEPDKNNDELPGPKDYKDISSTLNSLRIDGVLKAGLGISKSKIEDAFYESKIFINGTKALKKSEQANIDDEVDIIIEQSKNNPEHIKVSRVIVLKVQMKDSEKVLVKLRRFKSLLVEDYTKEM